MKRYVRLWWMYTIAATQIALSSRLSASLFLLGKMIRFLFFILFVGILSAHTTLIAGYSVWEILLFYFTFSFIDTTSQLFLRDVYRFKGQVNSGYFDSYLTKPISALYKALFGGSDILDVPLVILSVIFIVITLQHLHALSFLHMFLYILLLCNGLVIAVAFHIVVLCMGLLTTEVDNAIMLYRDITQMGRLPIDIYKEPLRDMLTFIFPIGIMMTFPAKEAVGVLSWTSVYVALSVSCSMLLTSICFWKFALKKYSGISS